MGLLGFFRTGYLARHAIILPWRLRPASGGYCRFVHGIVSALPVEVRNVRLGELRVVQDLLRPNRFESKHAWLKWEVWFNVDKTQTLVLFAHYGEGLTLTQGTIGALEANCKPFEYLIFREG